MKASAAEKESRGLALWRGVGQREAQRRGLGTAQVPNGKKKRLNCCQSSHVGQVKYPPLPPAKECKLVSAPLGLILNTAPKAPVSHRIPHLDGTAIQFNLSFLVFF